MSGRSNWGVRKRVVPRVARTTRLELLEARQLLALTVATLPATEITLRSARIGAEITDIGGTADPDLTIYWGDEDGGPNARGWDNVVNLRTSPVGQYTTDLTELEVNTTYYYRAFALSFSGGGAVWTDVASFATLPPIAAQLTANPPALVSESTVNVSGTVLDDGGQTPHVRVFYGTSDGGEQPADWTSSIELGPQAGEFTSRITGLDTDTMYFYRFAAENSGGTRWTAAQSFQTSMVPPLRISEMMAANATTALSRTRPSVDAPFVPTMKPYDWIELQNASAAPIDLTDYHLTDNRQLPLKWAFPAGTIIPAHGLLVVYASGEDIRDPALDEQGRLHTNFQISSQGEYVALTDPAGVVISEMDPGVPQFRDVSYATFAGAVGHQPVPTPGEPNEPLGPSVTEVTHRWLQDGDLDSPLAVSARVGETYDPLASVHLAYRVMFGDEVSVAMRDDGFGADVAAGDGIFTAVIPGSVAQPGEVLRYYVTATSGLGLVRREPTFVDPENSPQYFGTMVDDPNLSSNFPILHQFIEEPRRAETARGTRISVFYDGELYDNAYIRIRGGTARSWPKKSYKLEFNDDHQFRFSRDVPRVDEVNLNATYTDKSYVRARLTSEFQNDAGTPSPETFHIRMQQNNEFFSIAFLVEQPDRDFLRRHGMDPEGSLYKGGPGSYYTTGSLGAFEKKTREDETNKQDLRDLLAGLALRGEELERFVFDNVDLAAQINFMATNVVSQNIDASDKNHYLYRDTNGTGQWQMLPWDLDLVFGPDALNTDMIVADQDTRGATYPTAVHPFLGSVRYPLHAGKINMLLDAIITNPRTQEMFLRRVRTLTDEFLASGYFHQRIDELVGLLADEVPLDRATWGSQAHFGGAAPQFQVVAERIKQVYLDRRLPYLTDYHVNGGVGIPAQQPTDVDLEFGQQIEYAGSSLEPGQEYFTLHNPHAFAVDLSNWQIEGAISLRIKPGTVLAAGDSLYLTDNVSAFRQRAAGPAGNQGRFVQGYASDLPNTGGQLRLVRPDGAQVAELNFGSPAVPADSTNLRISEINYHPHDAWPQFGELVAGGDEFEFVELRNDGDQPIELTGVRFVETSQSTNPQGLVFHFASQVLAPGEYVVVVKNRGAFESRYGTNVRIALGDDGQGGGPGEYGNRLGNAGETITLVAASGEIIQSFGYGDDSPWPERADGQGSSLEWVGVGGSDPNSAASWQASQSIGGSPGQDAVPVDSLVVVNEIMTNSSAPMNDQIELFNRGGQPVDISGWYLTDSGNNLLRYAFPNATTLSPRGFLVLDQNQLGFGFNSDTGDDVWLIATDAKGRPAWIADYLAAQPTPPNVSLGRVPDGTGPLVVQPSPSFGQANSVGSLPGDFNGDGKTDSGDLSLFARPCSPRRPTWPLIWMVTTISTTPTSLRWFRIFFGPNSAMRIWTARSTPATSCKSCRRAVTRAIRMPPGKPAIGIATASSVPMISYWRSRRVATEAPEVRKRGREKGVGKRGQVPKVRSTQRAVPAFGT